MKKKTVRIGLGVVVVLVIAIAAVFLIWDKKEDKQDKGTESSDLVNVWVIGDSLAAAQAKEVESIGWGAKLQQFLKGKLVVRNAASRGASASRYIETGVLGMVLSGLKAGDYVIIQFGHNDSLLEDRWTDPNGASAVEGSFKYLLKNEYIKPIIEKGAHPILATSVMACGFWPAMPYTEHAQAMRELTEECKKEGLDITLVDTYGITAGLYNEIGIKEAEKFHTADGIHYNDFGATYGAGIIAEELKKAGLKHFQDIYTFEEVLDASEELQKIVEKLEIDLTGEAVEEKTPLHQEIY